MAVTITVRAQTGPTTWYLAWTSTLEDPTYYIYQDGLLIDTTVRAWRAFTVDAGDTLQVEILDAADETPEGAYPGRAYLQWDPVDDAATYLVQQYVDTDWVTQRTISARTPGVCHWESPVLDDMTTYQFQVVPVTAGGKQGTARPLTIEIVRRPDEPTLSGSYNSTTETLTLTIT